MFADIKHTVVCRRPHNILMKIWFIYMDALKVISILATQL